MCYLSFFKGLVGSCCLSALTLVAKILDRWRYTIKWQRYFLANRITYNCRWPLYPTPFLWHFCRRCHRLSHQNAESPNPASPKSTVAQTHYHSVCDELLDHGSVYLQGGGISPRFQRLYTRTRGFSVHLRCLAHVFGYGCLHCGPSKRSECPLERGPCGDRKSGTEDDFR